MIMVMTSNKHDQQGSVFFYLLIGIALFAALAFNITRGFRSQSTNSLTDKTALLAANDLMHYAQTIEQAVDRVRRKNCAESDISFDHTGWGHTNYRHNPVVDDKCKIFHPDGGGVSFENFSDFHDKNISGLNNIIFAGASEIEDIGTNCATAQCSELYLFVRLFHAENLCRELNDAININNSLPTFAGLQTTPLYNGTFTYGNTLSSVDLIGKNGGCYENTVENYSDGTPYYDFYYVLLAR